MALGFLVALLAVEGRLSAIELPPPLFASIAQISPGASPGEITLFEDAGETLYSVHIAIPGTTLEREWIFDGEGVPMGVEVFGKELPPALRTSLSAHTKSEGAEISRVVKIFEEGKPLFEVEFSIQGNSKVLGFYADGRPAYTERNLSSLPKPLQHSIKQCEQTEGTLESILQLWEHGPELYQIELKRPGKPLWITLKASGMVVKREEPVAYESTPEPVQAAILAKAGSGVRVRILRRQAWEVLGFEVCYLKDAKLHTLRLSQTGAFQGSPLEPLPLP
jgi:hypothetical protein